MSAARATFGIRQASRRWWVMLVLLVAASVWTYRTRGNATADTSRFGGPAQGTTYSVVLGKAQPAARVQALQKSVDSLLAVVDAQMSNYDPQSELSRFNRDTTNTPMPVSANFAEVMRLSMDVSRASQGAFDVTVGPLVDAWGFGITGDAVHAPSDTELAQLEARVGWEKITVTTNTMSKSQRHMEIDLSAVAPGYSVDLISALLTARGAPDHFVEVGGEVRARGTNAEGQAFRVGIEEPDPEQRRIRLVVGLSDLALATSGNYRDNRIIDGVRYTHILDPTTGRPVHHALLSVSVLHAQCGYADAWATALFAVGPERAWEMAKANKLDVLLLVAGVNGEVTERATDGFKAVILRDANTQAVDRTTRRTQKASPTENK